MSRETLAALPVVAGGVDPGWLGLAGSFLAGVSAPATTAGVYISQSSTILPELPDFISSIPSLKST